MARSALTVAVALAALLAASTSTLAQERNPEADAIAERTMQARVPGPMTIVGTLAEVEMNGGRIVLRALDGQETTVDVRSDAQIYMGAETLTLMQLAEHLDARVTASYTDVVGMRLASSLILREPDAP